MNAFAWRSAPSVLATTDRSFRSPVVRGEPKPSSHITYSKNVPHSINTESVADRDKTAQLRKGSPQPLFLPTVSDKAPLACQESPTDLSLPEAVSRFSRIDEALIERLAQVNSKEPQMKTMHQELLELLKREWVTPVDALEKVRCFSLSQRCGEFRRAGVKVLDKWVRHESGKRTKAYRVVG